MRRPLGFPSPKAIYPGMLAVESMHEIERDVLYEEKCRTPGCIYPARQDGYTCGHCWREVNDFWPFERQRLDQKPVQAKRRKSRMKPE